MSTKLSLLFTLTLSDSAVALPALRQALPGDGFQPVDDAANWTGDHFAE